MLNVHLYLAQRITALLMAPLVLGVRVLRGLPTVETLQT